MDNCPAHKNNEPLITTFVLPDWAGSALLVPSSSAQQAAVQILGCQPLSHGNTSHAKLDIKLLIVASVEGLRRFVKQ